MTRYHKILRRIQNHPILSIVLIIGILLGPFALITGIFQNVSSLFLKSKGPPTIHQEMEKSPGSIQAGRDINITIEANRPPESREYKNRNPVGTQSSTQSTTPFRITKPEKVTSKTKPLTRSEQNRGGEEHIKMKTKPKLWITYAWQDNAGRNFDFLIQELEKAGIDTTFDKVALVPGKRLWEQIAARIEDPTLDGWAILLTRQSLKSEPCREELAYALNRALSTKGAGFPLIGLMDQIESDEVPAALKARLMIDLRDHKWPQQVLAGLKGVASEKSLSPVTRYSWEYAPNFQGSNSIAIKVRPRFGELRNWRFIYSEGAEPLDWGIGPPKNPIMTMVVNGRLRHNVSGEIVTYVGAGDSINPGYGCYIVFKEPLPKTIGFGIASESLGPPTNDTIEAFTRP